MPAWHADDSDDDHISVKPDGSFSFICLFSGNSFKFIYFNYLLFVKSASLRTIVFVVVVFRVLAKYAAAGSQGSEVFLFCQKHARALVSHTHKNIQLVQDGCSAW